MILVMSKVDFLGMHFAHEAYNQGPHIFQELVKFPIINFTVKQLQQLFDVINYIRDFIPNVLTYISPLMDMLKRNVPVWGKVQDDVVRHRKEISKEVKTLHIPLEGFKLLQTDANNDYQSVVLLEEKDGQYKICEYAVGYLMMQNIITNPHLRIYSSQE